MRKNETQKGIVSHALKARGQGIRRVAGHPWIQENFRFLFGQMIDVLSSEGVTPVVIHYASRPPSEVQVFSDLSAEIARQKGVLVCDMQSRFEQAPNMDDLFIHTGVHVTPKRSEILAEELFKTISKDLRNKEN